MQVSAWQRHAIRAPVDVCAAHQCRGKVASLSATQNHRRQVHLLIIDVDSAARITQAESLVANTERVVGVLKPHADAGRQIGLALVVRLHFVVARFVAIHSSAEVAERCAVLDLHAVGVVYVEQAHHAVAILWNDLARNQHRLHLLQYWPNAAHVCASEWAL